MIDGRTESQSYERVEPGPFCQPPLLLSSFAQSPSQLCSQGLAREDCGTRQDFSSSPGALSSLHTHTTRTHTLFLDRVFASLCKCLASDIQRPICLTRSALLSLKHSLQVRDNVLSAESAALCRSLSTLLETGYIRNKRAQARNDTACGITKAVSCDDDSQTDRRRSRDLARATVVRDEL